LAKFLGISPAKFFYGLGEKYSKVGFKLEPTPNLDSTLQKYSIQVSFIRIILRILGVVFSLTSLFGVTCLNTVVY